MDKVKQFLANKKIGWYIELAALVFGLITVIVYGARGGNRYSPVSTAAVVVLVFAVITNLAVLVMDFRMGALVPLVLYGVALAILLNTEMLFLSNVMVGLDGNALDPAWYVFVIFEIVALLCAAVAFAMGLSKSDKLLAE